MLNSDEEISLDGEIRSSSTVSVILVTRNFGTPLFLHPEHIKSLIPKGISSEIILIKYNEYAAITPRDGKIEPECNHNSRIDIMQTRGEIADKIISESVTGNFTTAILKGLELTTGTIYLSY